MGADDELAAGLLRLCTADELAAACGSAASSSSSPLLRRSLFLFMSISGAARATAVAAATRAATRAATVRSIGVDGGQRVLSRARVQRVRAARACTRAPSLDNFQVPHRYACRLTS
jgi:hypothetical protein